MRAPLVWSVLSATLVVACGSSSAPNEAPSSVIVNKQALDASTVDGLQSMYHVKIAPGRYWYDRESGLAGVEGRPPIGVFVAHLDLGGPLPRDASDGHTAVLVNGRELSMAEVTYLSAYIDVVPGQYWLDDSGNVGLEGSSDPILNLYALIRAHPNANGGGDNFYANDLLNTATNSSGGCVYVSVDGADATSGC
jgi:hypothetical protein